MKTLEGREMPFDILDVNQIDLWIEMLSEAKKFGFSFTSSPVELLLELMVDLALKLRTQFKEGSTTWEARRNEGLKFSETQVDALNNPKVLKIRYVQKQAWDPQLSLFFEKLAETLIKVKHSKKLEEDLYSPKAPEGRHQKIDRRVYQYFRRQAFRKRKNNPRQ